MTLVSWAVVVQHLADDPKQPGSALGLCHSGYGNWLPKITLMVTTERWTNGVLTSILLRVGSSGGGLPSALQVFGFAGRGYFRHSCPLGIICWLSAILSLYLAHTVGFRHTLNPVVRLFAPLRILWTATEKRSQMLG